MKFKYLTAALMSFLLGTTGKAQQTEGESIPYSKAIPTVADYTPEKFRNVLESHGLHVESDAHADVAAIRVDAHGQMPTVWCPITVSVDNFDRHVFEKTPEQVPLERKLGMINQMTSPYFSNITPEMLESTQPFDLVPTEKALSELQQYKACLETGERTPDFFFNNPAGEGERKQRSENATMQMLIQSVKELEEAKQTAGLQREPTQQEIRLINEMEQTMFPMDEGFKQSFREIVSPAKSILPEAIQARMAVAVNSWGENTFSDKQLWQLSIGRTVEKEGKSYQVIKNLNDFRPVCKDIQKVAGAEHDNGLQL